MGGNALSKPSERLNKEDYNHLYRKINLLFIDCNLKIIKSYSDKESFGDMDILYYDLSEIDITSKLSTKFTITEVVKNGSVTSIGILFDSKLFQLDFIKSNKEEFEFSFNYFSYNDLGNLIGRIARSCELKFAHNGLWYIQRDGDQVLYSHLLISDFYEALEYLGLSAERHKSGFKCLDDIFDYVISSDYYDFNYFELSQRNYKARTRDRKRPNYNAFLKYVETHKKENTKTLCLEDHLKHFVHFSIQYKAVNKLNKYKKQYKEKFNGNIVMNLTGLEDKELGKFMSYCKEDNDFGLKRLISLDQDIINNNIINKHKTYCELTRAS